MGSHDSYLEPPDYGEGEMETTQTVYCQQELCNDFEKEVEWSGTADYYGTSYSSYLLVVPYTCPTCGIGSVLEFEEEVDEYYGSDDDGDRQRDEDAWTA